MIAAFGGSLLVLGGVKAIKGIANIWKKVSKTFKKTPMEVNKGLRIDAKVTKIKNEIQEKKREYDSELKRVYISLNNKDFKQAREEFLDLDKSLQNNPDVQKTIIADITKVLNMPPMYVQSPGNKSYQVIKQVLNIRIARAAAAATEMALKQVSGEEDD